MVNGMNQETAVYEFYDHPEKHPNHSEDGAVFLHGTKSGQMLMVTYGGLAGRSRAVALRQAREWAQLKGITVTGERSKE